MAVENVIYISGTHGSGKTTTIEGLCRTDGRFVLFKSQNGDHANPYQECFRRQVWRLNKYYLDSLDVLEQSSTLEQGQILIVDRCVFDTLSYISTFYRLAWLTEEQFDKLVDLYGVYYADKKLTPRNVVLFFPPFAWTKKRILERWNEEKKKWKEDNFEYLTILRDDYFSLYNLLAGMEDYNVFFLEETDQGSRIKKIIDKNIGRA